MGAVKEHCILTDLPRNAQGRSHVYSQLSVNIKTMKGRFMVLLYNYKFSTGRAMGVVKSVEKKKSVSGQFAVKYKSEALCWTQKRKKEDYGVVHVTKFAG